MSRASGEGRRGLRKLAGPLLLLGLLLAQPAAAAAYPIVIPYGRSWPISIVVDSSRGLAYVDGMSGINPPTGYTFGVINVTGHEVMKVLPLDEVPGVLALDESSGNVYVAGNDSIQVFYGGNQSMGERIVVGHPIRSMAYDGSVSKDIFVSAGNQVYAVDIALGRVVANATVGNGANGLALDPASGKLFVAEYPDSKVFVFDSQGLAPAGVINLPNCCAAQMAVDSRTHTIVATTGTGFVDLINTQTDSFENSVKVSPSSANSTDLVTVDNGTGRVFVSSSPGGSILEIDGSNGAVVGEFRVSSQVAGLAVDSKTHEVFATNYHQVTVFDGGRGRVLFIILALGAAAVVAVVVVAIVLVLRKPRRPGQ